MDTFMGKLIEKIERMQKSSGPRLGFAPPNATKQTFMLLVAVIPSSSAALAAAATAHGADGLLIKEVSTQGSPSLSPGLKLSSQTPVGVMLQGDQSERPAGDFVVVDITAPAAVLTDGEDIDVVLSVGLDLSDAELRVLEALPIDAVILPATEGPLTLENLIAYYRVTRSTNKPVLANVSGTPDGAGIRALRDAGISGFFVEVPDVDAAAVAALRRAIEDLPAKKPRKSRGRHAATVGMPSSMGFGPERTQEPDEDDGDDEP